MRTRYPSVGLLTYQRAQELISEYGRCPNCGQKDGLVAVRYGEYPPGKYGHYWKATSSDEIVCLECNCVWTKEEWFIELFEDNEWQEKLRKEDVIDER